MLMRDLQMPRLLTRARIEFAGLLALAAACVQPASADDVDPFSLSPEQLFNATVTSVSKTQERLGDAPAAIFVLTNEDIARSGATSIPEVLRLVPGVQVARGSTWGWAISVRGLNSALTNKLLVLIDGREVYDSLFSGVYWEIQDTALEDIERIEVIRGPGATLWGANAVNGVINIITKKASATQGLLASAVAGNQENALATARFGAGDDDAHWRVFAKYTDRAAQETLTGADSRDDWRAWRGGFRADWAANPEGDSFTLQGDLYTSDSSRFRSLPQLTAPYATTVFEPVSASGANILGRWHRDLGEESSFTVQALVDRTTRDQLPLRNERTAFDVDIHYDLPRIDAHEILVGARYRFTADDFAGSQIITIADPEHDTSLFSGFIQNKIEIEPDQLYLTLGSKFEHNDYSGFEAQPSARLQWMPDKTQMLWASISRAVRTPNLLEHGLTIAAGVIPPDILPLPVAVEVRPSPDFESEILVAYEAGYRHQWTPDLTTDVSLFYNDYDKLSTLSLGVPELGFPPLHIILPIATTNLTTGVAYGFEAWATWRLDEKLNVSAAYSYLDLNLDGPPPAQAIGAEAGEGQSPRNQFNLRAQWDVTDRVSFDSTLYYVDDLPSYAVSSYWRFDARVGWRVCDEVLLEIVGQNIFDDSHREFGNADDVGATEIQRSVFGRLTWRS
jgi:iron complex outermembrane receptor protein